MKIIKIGRQEYPVNQFNYYWNGSVLQLVCPTTRKIQSGIVPKKYYSDILFSNHKTITRKHESWEIGIFRASENNQKIIIMER